MEIWQSLVLGLVEGVTEFLPVSSTGHLILAANLMKLEGEAVKTYEICIQAGAILAVLVVYWRRLRDMLKGLVGRDQAGLRLLGLLVLAFLPAAVAGVTLNKPIKQHLFGPLPVMVALAGWAAVIFLYEAIRERRAADRRVMGTRELVDLTANHALLIGFAQCLAMWPGTSRSLVTLLAALCLGYRLAAAVEFAFLLGLITLSAATAHDGMTGGRAMLDAFGWVPIVVGFSAAAVSAFLAVKWMLRYLNSHGLAAFAWYRLLLAGVMLALLVLGVLK